MISPAADAAIAVSCRWPKLIVSGSRAEQPRPARPNAAIPAAAVPPAGARSPRAPAAATNGRIRYAVRSGSQRSMAANRIRPTVTMPQNAVSARDATAADAPRFWVMYTVAQLPFIVSTTP